MYLAKKGNASSKSAVEEVVFRHVKAVISKKRAQSMDFFKMAIIQSSEYLTVQLFK